jgi:hypothetical protein
MRNNKLVSYEKPQLGRLKKLIANEATGQGHVFTATISDCGKVK